MLFRSDSHVWVMSVLRNEDMSLRTVFFWEAVTGDKMEYTNSKVQRLYKTISCIFTSDKFYANIQEDNSIEAISFDFDNNAYWKKMDETILKLIIPWNFHIRLNPGQISAEILSEEIEEDLKKRIIKLRSGSNTEFDEEMHYMLAPELENYEIEKLNNESIFDDFLTDLIIPKKYKCVVHDINPNEAIEQIIRNGGNIIYTEGNIKFGIRAKVIVYPEDVLSIWIIIAARFVNFD